MWVSIKEGPNKPPALAADYNFNNPVDSKNHPPDDAKKVKMDIKAYNIPNMALSPEIKSWVEAYKTANTLWKALHIICEGSNEIKAIKKNTLRSQYENFTHLKGEFVPQQLHRFV